MSIATVAPNATVYDRSPAASAGAAKPPPAALRRMIIVGGGAAGWMTALPLQDAFCAHGVRIEVRRRG